MKQFLRFLTVGVFNTVLGYCVIFAGMYLAKMSPEGSNIAGYAVGLIASYVLNRKYTFDSRQNRRREVVRFLAVFAIAYFANYAALSFLIYKLGVHEGLSQLFSGAAYVIVSYLMNKYYVFNIAKTSRY